MSFQTILLTTQRLLKASICLMLFCLFLARNCAASGPPPVITVQPSSVNAPLLGIVSFSVTVSSQTTLTYQWFRDGSAIGGANSSSYTILTVLGTDSGTFCVKVTNAGGSVISSNAYLNSGPPPSITTQPQSQGVAKGQNVSLSVVASSTLSLSYQWYFGSSKLGSVGTGATLNLSNLGTSSAGGYSVVVSCTFGSVTSAVANVTVTNPVVTLSASPGEGMGMTSTGFSFQFSVPIGQTYVVLASSDLLNWAPVYTNVAASATIAVTDASAANFKKRYYRVILPN
jgi:hypothetical protein